MAGSPLPVAASRLPLKPGNLVQGFGLVIEVIFPALASPTLPAEQARDAARLAATDAQLSRTAAAASATSSSQSATTATQQATAAGTARVAAETALTAAETVRDQTATLASTLRITRDTLPPPEEWRTFPDDAQLEVLLGLDAGLYLKSGPPGSGTLTRKQTETIGSLAVGVRRPGGLGAGTLPLKNGVYPIVEDLVWIDRIGRLFAPEFAQIGAEPIVVKNGVMVLWRDAAGEPLIWFDLATRAVRTAGEALTANMQRGGYAWAVDTAAGDLISAIGSDGQHYQPAAARAPIPFAQAVDDGGGPVQQIHLADGTRARRLTCAPISCFNPSYVRPGLVRYARADGRLGLARSPIAAIPDTTAQTALDMVPIYGQSLALGSVSYAPGTAPLLPNPPTPRVRQFNGGVRTATVGGAYVEANYASLTSAREMLDGSTQLSETGATVLGFALTREVARDILVHASGLGGTPYVNLKKGNQNYANLLYAVTRGKALADAASRPFAVPALDWRQGESDEDKIGGVYLGYLDELLADLAADVPAITGQTTGPLLVLQQINRFDSSGLLYGPGQAQFVAGTTRERIILAAPQYVCEFGDVYHMRPESYQLMAAYKAKAIRRTVYEGRLFRPLYPTAANRSGKTIAVTFNVPEGRLALDASYVSNPGQYGVVFRDSADGLSGSAAVTAVELHPTDPTRLLVRLSGVPNGPSPTLGFAWWRTGADSNNQGRLTGLRTCIRDTDPEACPATGLPLHNYCVSSMIGVS